MQTRREMLSRSAGVAAMLFALFSNLSGGSGRRSGSSRHGGFGGGGFGGGGFSDSGGFSSGGGGDFGGGGVVAAHVAHFGDLF